MLYSWSRHMSQCLAQIRQNVKISSLNKKLQELSVTDVLTGVYNRSGCEQIAYGYLEECQQNGEDSILMIADVDRMKTINDQYGHMQGDMALRVLASVLKHELPKDWIISRYGGDEFFMAGKSDGVHTVADIIKNIDKNLERVSKEKKLPYPLTASIGGVLIRGGSTYSLDKYLQEADDMMYEAKKKRHEVMDQPISFSITLNNKK